MTRIVPSAALAFALLIMSSCGWKQEADAPGSGTSGGDQVHAVQDRQVSPARSDSVLAVRILPEIAGAGTRLHLSATGFRPGEGEIEWMVDGEPVPGQRADSFSTGGLRKGTSAQVRVKIGEQEVLSNKVTLINTPPELRSVRIVPDVIRPGDAIGVEVAGNDPDGDPVTFEYLWEKNGQPAGTTSRMEGDLHRNDVFSVRITPFDGESPGKTLVVRRKVNNFPPSVDGVIDRQLADGVYLCRIMASDGDGDPLTYSLMAAPPGMTIDPATGEIRWTVPDGFLGKVPITVSVTDGHEGKTTYPMFLAIREESP